MSPSEAAMAFNLCAAVAEAIREAEEIPSGTLYAVLAGKLDIATYQSVIRTLKNARLISEQHNLLKWIGPKLEKSHA